mgnify:CR=1 FL=1
MFRTATAVSIGDCLNDIGVQSNVSLVFELSAAKYMPTNASIPFASLSNIARVLSNHLGDFLVLGPLYPSSNKIFAVSAKLCGSLPEAINCSPEAFLFLMALT